MLTNRETWQNTLQWNKMITTTNFQIEKIQDLTSKYIETELKKKGVVPLRWAIVDEDDTFWVVSASYEK